MTSEIASGAAVAPEAARAVRLWLRAIWFMVLLMVLIGGITRLTGSGLSITEWRPIAGALPPLTEGDWVSLFAKYQRSPEFRQVNRWMALSDFKRIFFWEYVHRLVGRLIGGAVLLPWLYFLSQKVLARRFALKIAVVIGLGALQGLLGWLMVQSGLVSEPSVSHYRLAAHLLLAFATGQWVLWLALETTAAPRSAVPAPGTYVGAIAALLVLLAFQVAYGAFMAGTHAGYYFATFPDMNGAFAPHAFFSGRSPWHDAIASPLAIHYLHRTLAWLALAYAVGLWVYLRRADPRAEVRRAASWVALAAFVQLNLGAFTVVTRVALPWALVHQAMAYVLVSSAVLLLHRALRASG